MRVGIHPTHLEAVRMRCVQKACGGRVFRSPQRICASQRPSSKPDTHRRVANRDIQRRAKMMGQGEPHADLLLLGAGFSRNWGVWLASEAFDHLVGSPEAIADDGLRKLLWRHQHQGGFEAAFAREAITKSRTQRVRCRCVCRMATMPPAQPPTRWLGLHWLMLRQRCRR